MKEPPLASAIKGKSSDSSPSWTPTPQPNHAGAVAGGVVGGLAGIALILTSAFYLVRRRQSSPSEPDLSPHGMLQTRRYEMESQPVELESLPVKLSGADRLH
ncbi:hypothetical protein N7G274_001825 [Stereocaulon virgatum]|uniref:Uncharacterized protein n=1 Tax=Stereocaulon virgatum TaxID=373712 RepID=A0ABR4AKT3_9LECA